MRRSAKFAERTKRSSLQELGPFERGEAAGRIEAWGVSSRRVDQGFCPEVRLAGGRERSMRIGETGTRVRSGRVVCWERGEQVVLGKAREREAGSRSACDVDCKGIEQTNE